MLPKGKKLKGSEYLGFEFLDRVLPIVRAMAEAEAEAIGVDMDSLEREPRTNRPTPPPSFRARIPF